MNKIYDAHSHFVPAVYLDALKKHNAVLEDGFPPPVWNADAHLKFMEEAVSVLRWFRCPPLIPTGAT